MMVDQKRDFTRATPEGSAMVAHDDGRQEYWPSFEIEDPKYVQQHRAKSAKWVVWHTRTGRYWVCTPLRVLGHPWFPKANLETLDAALMWIALKG